MRELFYKISGEIRYIKYFINIFIYFYVCASFSLGAEPQVPKAFDLIETTEGALADSYLQVIEDPGLQYDIDYIASKEAHNKFKYVRFANLGLRDFDTAIWVRLPLQNSTDSPITRYLEFQYSLLRHIQLYIPDPQKENGFHVKKSGYHTPMEERDVRQGKLTFEVETPPRAVQFVYMRIIADDFINISIKVWPFKALLNHLYWMEKFWGVFYGIIIAMIFVNACIWILSRYPPYIIYVFYLMIIFMIQYQYNGHHLPGIWPSPVWKNGNVGTVYAAYAIGVIFAISFLQLKKHFPTFTKLLYGLATVLFSVVFLSFFVKTTIFKVAVPYNVTIIFSLYIVLAILLIRKRFVPAYYYLAGLLLIFSGAIVLVMALQGVIPANKFTMVSFAMGALAELFVFSFGLIYQFTRYQSENYSLRYKNYRNRAFPHFLFNSLDSIHGVIEENRLSKAKKLITQLTEIYRFITYKGLGETISLKDELEFCESYMAIMNTRHENMITYKYSVEKEVNKVEIPPFLVQSFLENAIKHGFDGLSELKVEVSVFGNSKGGVNIVIKNNGRPLEEKSIQGGTLESVNSLLEILYEKTELTYKNGEDGEVFVTISFAKKRPGKSFYSKKSDFLPD